MTTAVPIQPAEREYVLGTDAFETSRLGLQHRLWSAAAHALWERAGVRPGSVVLDLGCGPGYAAFDLAMIVGATNPGQPQGRVIALDESERFLRQLSQAAKARDKSNIDVVLCDAAALERERVLPDGAVDFVYARWVFCFLKDPEAVVRGLARLLKPGGAIVVQDYFNYASMTLAPRRPIYDAVVAATAESWRSHGGNPDVAGHLPGMMARHGLRLDHLHVHQRIARPGSTLWAWPDSWWKSYVPKLVSMGFLTQSQASEFFAVWAEASNDPSTFAVVPPVFDLIAVKG
jgi:ubiquinone/menaquinone biosynthesis C-methylase UbiE